MRIDTEDFGRIEVRDPGIRVVKFSSRCDQTRAVTKAVPSVVV